MNKKDKGTYRKIWVLAKHASSDHFQQNGRIQTLVQKMGPADRPGNNSSV